MISQTVLLFQVSCNEPELEDIQFGQEGGGVVVARERAENRREMQEGETKQVRQCCCGNQVGGRIFEVASSNEPEV